jgi:hypothetical protein
VSGRGRDKFPPPHTFEVVEEISSTSSTGHNECAKVRRVYQLEWTLTTARRIFAHVACIQYWREYPDADPGCFDMDNLLATS